MDFFIGLLVGAIVVGLRSVIKKQENRERAMQWNVADPVNQLRFVDAVDIRTRRPINAEAYRAVFLPAERVLPGIKTRHRILAEVAMGSFPGTTDQSKQTAQDRAFQSFNSKRVDFLIIDHPGNPALAIEYHSTGHYLSDDAEKRDAVKRRALQRAGIPLLEFGEGVSPIEVGNKVKYVLTKQK